MANDRSKILVRLNAALKDENFSAHCYQIQAEESRKKGHERLARRLESIAHDHNRHIEAIKQRIRHLGAEPQEFQPPQEILDRIRCMPHEDLCMALEHDLKAEDTEIETYQTLAEQSDRNTADLCRSFSGEDRQHVNWLRDELVRGLNLEDEFHEND